jgi:hypothetical protein
MEESMTSTGMVTTAVEQAFFQLTEDGTTSVVASSFAVEQAELGWLSLLGPYLGFSEVPGSPSPVHALSYLVFPDGFAAVLRRTQDARRPGCVDAHALLGLDAQLTPAVALSASDWSGWRDDPPADRQLARLRADEVQVPAAADRLRARALSQGDLLARSLAWLLQSPGTPIGLIGCPDEDRIALVWALREIAAPVLTQRQWTFSTHGDAAHNGRTAAIAFFSTPPDRTAAAGHMIVDLHRDQGASPQNEYRANALVYRYEYGVDPPNVNAAPAVLPVPAPVPNAPSVPVPASNPTLPFQAAPVRLTPPPGQSAVLVRDVVTARDGRALDGALVELEYAVAKVDDRDEVRKALESAGWAAAAIHRHIPFDLRESMFDRVVRVAFGATGPGRTTPGARVDARRLAANSDSEELVRAIARASAESDLADVLARRWMLEHEPVALDPTAGLGPVGRFLRYCGLPVTPAWERRVLLMVALLLSFVLGVVVSGVVQ